jgi:hypothetical protein
VLRALASHTPHLATFTKPSERKNPLTQPKQGAMNPLNPPPAS